MINLTSKAHQRVLKLRSDSNLSSDYNLRISVIGGGCSGLSYNLDFDDQIETGDEIFDYEDIKLVVNLKSYLYLANTTLDFSDGLNGKGFHFENPNAHRTCSCGESFGL